MHTEVRSQRITVAFKIFVLLVAIGAILVSVTQFAKIGINDKLVAETAVQVKQSSADNTPTTATPLTLQTASPDQTTNFIWITISVLILTVFTIIKCYHRKTNTW